MEAINKESALQRLKSYRKHPLSAILSLLVVISAVITLTVLIALIAYILIKGIPNLSPELFEWEYTTENVSMMPAIINTLIITALSLLFALPVGICSAIYLVEYAKRGNKLVSIVRITTETLSGIPSIVYGLFGYLFFNIFLEWSYTILGGALTLAIMILPTVINISVSSIRAVPGHLKSASLALGATHIQTIFKVMIPAARSGIMTGVVLGIGRALGEAMAINLVAGGSVNLPLPFNSVRFLTTQIVSEMSYAEGLHREVLFTVGLVLFIFIMIINLVLAQVEKKGAVEK